MKNAKILIKWLDSKEVINHWEHLDELEALEPAICESIGYIIENNNKFITIAQTISDSQILGRMTIPHCAIIKKQKVK